MTIDLSKLPEDVRVNIEWCGWEAEPPTTWREAFSLWHAGYTARNGERPDCSDTLAAFDAIRAASGEGSELERLPVNCELALRRVRDSDWAARIHGPVLSIGWTELYTDALSAIREALRAAQGEKGGE